MRNRYKNQTIKEEFKIIRNTWDFKHKHSDDWFSNENIKESGKMACD